MKLILKIRDHAESVAKEVLRHALGRSHKGLRPGWPTETGWQRASLLNGWWHSDVNGAPCRRDGWPRSGWGWREEGVRRRQRGKWVRIKARVGRSPWGRGLQGVEGTAMKVRDSSAKRQKEKRWRERRLLASGLLPHLLVSLRKHAGAFNLRRQLRDVMRFDGLDSHCRCNPFKNRMLHAEQLSANRWASSL